MSGDCKINEEVREAIRTFAAKNGRRWKSKLREAWMNGENLGTELQIARNVIGPIGLDRITKRVL